MHCTAGRCKNTSGRRKHCRGTHLYHCFRNLDKSISISINQLIGDQLALGEGRIEKVDIILSGYSCGIQIREQALGMIINTTSRNLDSSREPKPAPVPPPSEWIIWKPCRASQASACLRMISYNWRMSSLPNGLIRTAKSGYVRGSDRPIQRLSDHK